MANAKFGNLRSFQELLNDHCGTAFSKFGIRHHIGDCIHSLLPGLADEDALPQGQALSLIHISTITEIRMIDTYWSDHCRHTTFLTTIDQVKFADPLLQAAYNDYLETRKELGRTKPVNLMDIGTLAAK